MPRTGNISGVKMIKFENKSNGRYYYIFVETDIFGHNILGVIRGGMYKRGVYIAILSGNMGSIAKKIQEITVIRLRRGYTIVN